MNDAIPAVPRPLGAAWRLRAVEPEDARAPRGDVPARVPGSVHADLLRAGIISDPHVGTNDEGVQWVGTTTWEYEATVDLTDAERVAPHLDLCLDGLDTVCTVSVNGRAVLTSENMFVPQRVDLRPHVRPGANTVTLRFGQVLAHGRALEAEHGRRAAWNGDPSRVYVRKAPYHYGWDWGPIVLTAGPWRDVTVHAYAARLDAVRTALTVADDLRGAQLTVSATVAGTPAPDDTVHVTLRGPDGTPLAHVARPAAAAHATVDVPQPQLWWPRGHGAQPLYTVEVTLGRGALHLDRVTRRVGARHLRLAQEPVAGEAGTSFTFVVNGVPVFAGGANWIPEDTLLSRVTPARVRERLTQAAAAHMVMVRVWGGGVYEQDAFYDVCDELGLLVWQDFMFACGMYPAHPAFVASVEAEARAAVLRLRHHPSVALWCGNNEDYAIAESVGASGPGIDPARLDARVIYEEVLPRVVADLHPEVPYWPGSPWGGETSADPTVGDRHTWEVWHGPMAPHRDYGRFEGRFVSEFGLQSPPGAAVIAAFTRPEDRTPHGRVMEHHNRAADPTGRPDGSRRLAAYLSDTFAPARDFEEYVYHARVVHADAMVSAYRAFRGRWGHAGARAVSGALVWQLNDCWPATSWAVIDVAGVPKPAYHAIRRELAPLAVQARRDGQGLRAWVVSALHADADVDVTADVYAPDGTVLDARRWPARAAANAVTPLPGGPDAVPDRVPDDAVVVLAAWRGGVEVSRAALWPEPPKHHLPPDPQLEVRVDGRRVTVHARRSARAVWVEAGAARPDDNHLDLRPGERVTVTVDADVDARDVSVRAVGSGVVRPLPAAPAP